MIIKQKRLSEIKEEWNRLEREKNSISLFNTYAFASCLYKGYFFRLGTAGIPEFYLIYDKNELLMICPVIKNRIDGKTTYSSFGSKMFVVEENFIYPDYISDQVIVECICTLTEKIGKVSFEHVSEDSRIYMVLLQKGLICNARKEVNALIELPEVYTAYYNKLSKNMRQNIRTAKNRLVSDNMIDEVQIYYGNEMSILDYLRFMTLYVNSIDERYPSERSIIRGIAHRIYRTFFHHHARALNKIESSVCVIYRINNIPAAILGGYLDNTRKRVYWHIVGFDSLYSRYSPGILMFQRTIEKMIESTDIKFFDLSIGGEEYKFRLGAKEYYDRRFDIVPINSN